MFLLIISFSCDPFAVLQSLSHVQLFETPWTVAYQASLFFTTSLSLLRLMSPWVSDAIQPSHPLSPSSPFAFPASGSFPMSQFFISDGQSTGASASTSVLPMNIQDWFPSGLTGLISLWSKGLSGVFSSTTVQKCQFFSASLWSNFHIHTWLLEKVIALTRWTFIGKVMSLLFNMLSRFVIPFLPKRSTF